MCLIILWFRLGTMAILTQYIISLLQDHVLPLMTDDAIQSATVTFAVASCVFCGVFTAVWVITTFLRHSSGKKPTARYKVKRSFSEDSCKNMPSSLSSYAVSSFHLKQRTAIVSGTKKLKVKIIEKYWK